MSYKMEYTANKAYMDATNNKSNFVSNKIKEIMPKIEEDIIEAAKAGFFYTCFDLDIAKIKKEILIDSRVNEQITFIISAIDSVLKENLYFTNIDDIFKKYSSKFDNLRSVQINIYWNDSGVFNSMKPKSCFLEA